MAQCVRVWKCEALNTTGAFHYTTSCVLAIPYVQIHRAKDVLRSAQTALEVLSRVSESGVIATDS